MRLSHKRSSCVFWRQGMSPVRQYLIAQTQFLCFWVTLLSHVPQTYVARIQFIFFFRQQTMSPKNIVFVFWAVTCSCCTYRHFVFFGDKWCFSCDSFCRTKAVFVFLGDKHVTWKILKCITIIIIFLYYCNCCYCLVFIIITLLSLINVCLLTYDRDERSVEPSTVPLKPAVEIDNFMYKV